MFAGHRVVFCERRNNVNMQQVGWIIPHTALRTPDWEPLLEGIGFVNLQMHSMKSFFVVVTFGMLWPHRWLNRCAGSAFVCELVYYHVYAQLECKTVGKGYAHHQSSFTTVSTAVSQLLPNRFAISKSFFLFVYS